MAKDRDEFSDVKSGTAVADLIGRRHGRVVVVIGKGMFRIRWEDDEDEILQRHQLLVRYTTESPKFIPGRVKVSERP